MPRQPRIHSPGLLYHVICRGNQKMPVFLDDQDFRAYLARIAESHAEFPFRLYAYALMGNHVHLLMEAGKQPIAKPMQIIQQRYTQYFNKKYDKIGHIFHGRYKAIVCDRDAYLLELIRYIHLNPVRAGAVKDPSEYPWTSHNSYLAKKVDPWLDRDAILQQFAEGLEMAQKRYLDFVMGAIQEGHREDLYAVQEQQILGDTDFVESLPIGDAEPEPEKQTQYSLEMIEKAVADAIGIKRNELHELRRDNQVVIYRGMVGLLAIECGHKLEKTANHFKRDSSSMSRTILRAKSALKTNNYYSELKKKLDEMLP